MNKLDSFNEINMISESQQVLLETLKASLFGANPSYPRSVRWDEVIEEAKIHTVLGLISEKIPTNDIACDQNKAIYIRFIYEQEQLVRLLNSANIPFVVIKGFASAMYYPKPHLRAIGDIDILVTRDRFVDAVDLLESAGYTNKEPKKSSLNNRHMEFLKNGITIELHHHFSSVGFDIDGILENAISKREYFELNGYTFPVLPTIENGLVLLGHINQHLKNDEIGLRQIIDWAMYLHFAIRSESWEKSFLSVAEDTGFLTLAAYVTDICNRYLGLPESLCICRDVHDDLSECLLQIIMASGNFGRREDLVGVNDERRVRYIVLGIRNKGFFSYFTSVGFEKWKYGNKGIILAPVAFVYGVFYALFNGIVTFLRNRSVTRQIYEGKKKYILYKKIGVRSKHT